MSYTIVYSNKKAENLKGYVTKENTLVTAAFADPEHPQINFRNKWHAIAAAHQFAATAVSDDEDAEIVAGYHGIKKTESLLKDNFVNVYERNAAETEDPETGETKAEDALIYSLAF